MRRELVVVELDMRQNVFDGDGNRSHIVDGLRNARIYEDEIKIPWDHLSVIEHDDWKPQPRLLALPLLKGSILFDSANTQQYALKLPLHEPPITGNQYELNEISLAFRAVDSAVEVELDVRSIFPAYCAQCILSLQLSCVYLVFSLLLIRAHLIFSLLLRVKPRVIPGSLTSPPQE
jgi:hypothetical protein